MSAPCRILVLGASSAMAQAYARRRAATGASFLLVGLNATRLAAVADDLRASGAPAAEIATMDLADLAGIETRAADLRGRFGEPDEVLIAYGELPDQAESERDLDAARHAFEVNFVSVALWILALLKDRPPQAPLALITIGSVAGDRGRASNFVYGAAKGGLDRFLEGLAQKHAGTPVRIVTVKPGFVDSPMTDAIAKGALFASPDAVGADIVRAVEKGRRVVYAPWFWWVIMAIIRNLPWFVFRRLRI
ncbi:SDR family NAD(P)-dependent oxidoreductase [Rhodoplanes sp. TEM]|uniref:SDR family NAD(P)-dependent oxidoreductase n=1 Tax=Rhodoplanes tepidamans TaxID=200616 RepID=A0ABT5JDJ4_RHOTP|nr:MULTISPECIES: SDR family NAD(P)-dependent oxidoreductase [Rhodoplanes]MDC7787692.1 SDR family NAD(P)-dependent oxidoreductase [Rhodoplanes tepidamans]MDC7983066.1 SDR family NAD(P)-dependent oxidoreductase [Rhodoplanes sp. TEM]MDQ0356448.1 short-subunit dehydrogenase [Rhodoplanes tepidamans]